MTYKRRYKYKCRPQYRSWTKVRRKPQPAQPVVHAKGHWSKPIAFTDPEYKDPGLRERYCLTFSQVRYRGVTELVVYRKDIKPTIWNDWTGYRKKVANGWDRYDKVCFERDHTQFSNRKDQATGNWYQDPIANLSYEEFQDQYDIYEEFKAYTD